MDTTIIEPPVKRKKSADGNDEEELVDIFCDPKNPKILSFQDVSAAAYKIKNGIQHTPCTRSQMSSMLGMKVFFKKEFLQYTGSFKERGARYTLMMLNEEQKQKGVIAASAGNHALALSYHGVDLGIPVTVVMPLIAPLMKIQACKNHGAKVIMKGNNIGEATKVCHQISKQSTIVMYSGKVSKQYAMKIGQEQNLLYINGYDHPHILSGQGTMGLEIVEQVPDLDACIIPVGGGGLIAGSALAIKSLRPNVIIIGAESEKCPSFTAALKAGKPVFTETSSTLADGLAVPTVGVNAYATANSLIDKMVVVKEENIALSILRLLELEKAVVEGAGATALAAVMEGQLPELAGKKVVIALCGGNIDTTALGRVIERGLAVDGRLVRFAVRVSDRPGGIAELTKMLADMGVRDHSRMALRKVSIPTLRNQVGVLTLRRAILEWCRFLLCAEHIYMDGRLVRFAVRVSDRPGGIAELTKMLADMGVSIKDIFHERAWLKSDIFAVQVKCVCETRDLEHSDELQGALKKRYAYCEWGPGLF